MESIIYRTYLTFSVLLLFPFNSGAQYGFVPRKMDKTINSSYSEFNPVITGDGKLLYFTRACHPENNHHPEEHFGPDDTEDIWFSRLQPDGKWTMAQRLPAPLNTAYYNSLLSILDNRTTILLNGVFDNKGHWIKRGLSLSNLSENGWSQPQALRIEGKLKNNIGKASSAFLTGDNQLLFLSFSSTFNSSNEDLYLSKKSGEKWSKPIKFLKDINTKKYSETAPFYSSKEQKLYFASNRNTSKTDINNFDIYYTKPTDKNFINWAAPVRLGDTINTRNWESYYKLNEEATMAYFARQDSGKTTDIYHIKLKEHNPLIQLSGTVLTKSNNEPLDQKYGFKILANDKLVDSIIIHEHSSHFIIKLPLGQKYYIKALVKNHISMIDSIDATGIKEFTEIEKDLFVDQIPFVIMTGKILLKNTLTPLEDSITPKLLVDGKAANQTFDIKTGGYQLNLKYGLKHTIVVKTQGYESETASIDLTSVNKFSEMQKDFYLQKVVNADVNEVIITGQVIDKKTGKPISPDKHVSIFANDIPAQEVHIDNKTSVYKLVVPLGKVYVINATSPKYYPVYEIIDLKNQTNQSEIIKNLIIAPIEVGMSVKLNNIFFENGKANLKKESFPEILRIVKFLKENENIRIEISGHTDNVGDLQGNLLLSQQRALAVANYIKGSGISPDRLISKGYGMSKPVTTNNTKKGKASNRRVEFVILEK